MTPKGEDGTGGAKANAVTLSMDAPPPGDSMDLFGQAEAAATDGAAVEGQEEKIDFLRIIAAAEAEARSYQQQTNQASWSRSYKAFHNKHFTESKYNSIQYRSRSKIFRPKTRSAVRKQMAAVAASLFGTVDSLSCLPGDESNPKQRASAALLQEVVNYRTDRTSGRAAIPWFLVCMGGCQDAIITGLTVSKQYWKLELRPVTNPDEIAKLQAANKLTPLVDPQTNEQKFFTAEIDRPDVMLFPAEQVTIDAGANWTNPAQDAAFLMLKIPMKRDEIERRQNDPRDPWKPVAIDKIKAAGDATKSDTSAVRRSREGGLDRFDDVQSSGEFGTIWVYENFVRIGGEDWCFYSAGTSAYLTDPRPVREVYPFAAGERPIRIGYSALEAHRIYPMSPVESWQQLQTESNDLTNLGLDTLKQAIAPMAKVRRGRNIDLDQLNRRGPNWTVLVQDPADIEFEQPPAFPAQLSAAIQKTDIDFDDQAGQFNSGTVQDNRSLNETVGGLKLIAGAANTVQEFDIRVWIETWVEPVLAQLVQLEQYYESDATLLELCGTRAKLFTKHGINVIDDDLIDQQVAVRVNAGLGAGDPQQRLQKFQSAVAVVAPLLAQTKEFQSGQRSLDPEAICDEVFGAVGYRDGGKRFFKDNPPPQQGPEAGLMLEKLLSEIAKNKATAENQRMTGIAALHKAGVADKQVDAQVLGEVLGHIRDTSAQRMNAIDMGNRHANDLHATLNPQPAAGSLPGGGAPGAGPAPPAPGPMPALPPPAAAPPGISPQGALPMLPPPGQPGGAMHFGGPEQPEPEPQAPPDDFMMHIARLITQPRERRLEFVRDPVTGRITGAKEVMQPIINAGQG